MGSLIPQSEGVSKIHNFSYDNNLCQTTPKDVFFHVLSMPQLVEKKYRVHRKPITLMP